MKKTLSIVLVVATLLMSAPMSAYAVDTLSDDPIDQIEPSDTKPDPAEVERIIREFLRDELHFNEAVTCGILANIYVECKFDPGDSYLESGGYTSYGICQWNRDRLQGMIDYCAAHGYKPSDVRGQLGFVKYELETTEKNAYAKIRSISNDAVGAYEAGYNWARYYERCNEASYTKRANLAKDTYWPVYGKYLPIGLNVPYYAAESDTLTASFAMAEAYLAGYPSGDSRVIEGLAGLALDDLYTESAADPGTIFAALNEGIPVILRYADGRAAVIYGYDGDSAELDPAGLRLLIPASGQLMPGSYGRVTEEALSSCSVLIRKDLAAALPLCEDGLSGLNLDGFAHPVGLPGDRAIRLGGRLTSDGTLTSVEITLTDGSGKLLASTSAQPNSKLYDLALLPTLAGGKTLPAGDYTLTLTAADASGAILEYSDPLTVSGLPLAGRIGECSADPLSKEEAQVPGIYRITAKSGLNVRSGPSTDSSKLTAIPYGETVTVTELSGNGWGKTTYEGRVGWISMQYAEFVSTTGFVISYHGNGGSGAPAAAVKLNDAPLYLSDTLPARTGYRFLGWSVNRLSTVAEYEPGDPYTANGKVTLYAVWEEIVPVYADVSGDGSVNERDAVLLQQYLNGFDVTFDYVASDLDGDGIISMRDIVLLQRHLNEAIE